MILVHKTISSLYIIELDKVSDLHTPSHNTQTNTHTHKQAYIFKDASVLRWKDENIPKR